MLLYSKKICDNSKLYNLTVQDDDGDIVKCRWSTNIGNDECGGVCQTFPGSVLDEVGLENIW